MNTNEWRGLVSWYILVKGSEAAGRRDYAAAADGEIMYTIYLVLGLPYAYLSPP